MIRIAAPSGMSQVPETASTSPRKWKTTSRNFLRSSLRSSTLVLKHTIMLPFESVGYRTEFGCEKCVQNSRKENDSGHEIEGVCLNSPYELLRDSGHISIGILCEGRWEACCCFRCLHRLQAGAEKGEEDQAE